MKSSDLQGLTILRFNSRRARLTALRHLHSEGRVVVSLYSLKRFSTGGYSAVLHDAAKDVLSRKIPGVSRLRGPYDDLMTWCP